jgi:hypothetical protein
MQPTAEQRQRYYDQYLSKWWHIERSTRPADRPRAQAAIAGWYQQAQLEAPRVIWLPCALSAALSATLYAAFRYSRKAPKALWRAVDQQLDMAKRTVPAPWVPQGQSLKTPLYRTVDYVVACAMNYSLHNVDGVVHSNVERVLNWIERSAEGYGPDHWHEPASPGEYSVGTAVRSTVQAAVRAAVHQALDDGAATSRDKVTNVPVVCDEGLAFANSSRFSGDCAWVDWAIHDMGLPIERHFLDLAEACGNCWMLDDVCFASERPSINNLGYAGHAHCETGPTIAFPSGWDMWHWHGVRVPRHVIEHPERLTPSRIQRVENAEVRRVMIERYGGEARFIVHSGARLIHEDARGKLWRSKTVEREPIVIVEVRNSTPEPDGSFKTYFLRVPPEMHNASAAVAWTFGLTTQTYQPREET